MNGITVDLNFCSRNPYGFGSFSWFESSFYVFSSVDSLVYNDESTL